MLLDITIFILKLLDDMLFAAIPAVGFASHRYLAHPKAFTVAAIIPMIPGVHAYKAMISMVQIHHFGFSDALFEQMISSFINTSFILGAIVFGLALPGLLFYRQKPVV